MLYKINITRSIFDGASDAAATQFAIMLRTIELPFPPTVGLKLFLLKPETITNVIWYVESETFSCSIDSYYSEAKPGNHSFDEKIQSDELQGFKKIDHGKLNN